MKLNLLPQTVSKGRALKTAWVLGACLMIGSLIIAILLSTTARAAVKGAEAKVDENKQAAADAVTTAASADGVVASAADVIRNAKLSQAMIEHNDVYPQLYGEITPYIPSFFRINAISATAIDATTSRVTMVGTIGSYQQYADVILALMRYKNAVSISRSGYNYDPTIVPALTPDDPNGIPRKNNAPPIPDDQIQRIALLQSQVQPTGFQNVANYGSPQPDGRGAMPGESLITIDMTVKKDLRVPDPQSTLAAAGSAGGGAAAAGSGGGLVGPGGPPPGAFGVPGGPPPGVPGGPTGGTTRSRRGGGAGGDD